MDESEVKRRERGRAWMVHGGLLGALLVVYLVAFADSIGASGLDGLASAIVGGAMLVYAAISTLLVAVVGRRPVMVVGAHAAVIVGWLICSRIIYSGRMAEAEARANEARERLEREQRERAAAER